MPARLSSLTLSRMCRRLWGSMPTVGSSRMSSLRPVHERDADVDPPLHAAREFGDRLPLALLQPDDLQHFADALLERLAAQAVHLAPEGEVLAGAQVGIEGDVLRHEADRALDRHRLVHDRVAHDPGIARTSGAAGRRA